MRCYFVFSFFFGRDGWDGWAEGWRGWFWRLVSFLLNFLWSFPSLFMFSTSVSLFFFGFDDSDEWSDQSLQNFLMFREDASDFCDLFSWISLSLLLIWTIGCKNQICWLFRKELSIHSLHFLFFSLCPHSIVPILASYLVSGVQSNLLSSFL